MKKCSKCKKVRNYGNFFKDLTKKDLHTSSCKLCIKRQQVRDYEKNALRARKQSKVYYQKNKLIYSVNAKAKRDNRLKYIFELLNNKCNRCGLEDKRLLNIDHIRGGGNKERKFFGGNYQKYHEKVIESINQNKNEYQLLCFNCNQLEAVEKGYKTTIW